MKEMSKITKLVAAIATAIALLPVPGCWEEDNYENHNHEDRSSVVVPDKLGSNSQELVTS